MKEFKQGDYVKYIKEYDEDVRLGTIGQILEVLFYSFDLLPTQYLIAWDGGEYTSKSWVTGDEINGL